MNDMMPIDGVKARGRAETDIPGKRHEAMKRYIDLLETITTPGPKHGDHHERPTGKAITVVNDQVAMLEVRVENKRIEGSSQS
jgi:hypothetical protein